MHGIVQRHKTDTEQRWKAVKAHIARGDKAKDKADQHYIAAGQYLKELKAEHTGTWAEWETLVKEKAGIGKSRASELMQIADGIKTVEEVKGARAERDRKAIERRKSSPPIGGETKEPESVPEQPIEATRGPDNARDPEISAAIRKAPFAAMEAAEAADNAEQPAAEQRKRLTRKERRELLRVDAERLAAKLIDTVPEIARELHAMLWKDDRIASFLMGALGRGLGEEEWGRTAELGGALPEEPRDHSEAKPTPQQIDLEEFIAESAREAHEARTTKKDSTASDDSRTGPATA
jgi:hypothetical protein